MKRKEEIQIIIVALKEDIIRENKNLNTLTLLPAIKDSIEYTQSLIKDLLNYYKEYEKI